MDTSDDLFTLAAGVAGGIQSQQEAKRGRKRARKKRKISAQLADAAKRKRTSPRTIQRSEAATRNRRAAIQPTGFAPPVLGSTGQLGR